jgi:hypothetical protein
MKFNLERVNAKRGGLGKPAMTNRQAEFAMTKFKGANDEEAHKFLTNYDLPDPSRPDGGIDLDPNSKEAHRRDVEKQTAAREQEPGATEKRLEKAAEARNRGEAKPEGEGEGNVGPGDTGHLPKEGKGSHVTGIHGTTTPGQPPAGAPPSGGSRR